MQTLQRITLLAGGLDSNIVFDHQFCKLFAVDQNNFLGEPPHMLASFLGELRCGYHHAFEGIVFQEAAAKLTNLRAANSPLPTLSLDVDHVQAQLVLLDSSVNSAITRLAHYRSGVFQCAAVSHRDEKVHHDLLEALGADLLHRFPKIVGQCPPKRQKAALELFLRRAQRLDRKSV